MFGTILPIAPNLRRGHIDPEQLQHSSGRTFGANLTLVPLLSMAQIYLRPMLTWFPAEMTTFPRPTTIFPPKLTAAQANQTPFDLKRINKP